MGSSPIFLGKLVQLATGNLLISVRNLSVGHNFPSNGAHLAELTLEIDIIGPQGNVLRRKVRSYRSLWANSFGSL